MSDWVLLAYRLPREPSTPRIAVWRKLERIGAARLLDGLVALPRDGRTQEQLEWIAEEIIEAGGEASIWFATPSSRAHESAAAARMSERVAVEYTEVIRSAAAARGEHPSVRRRTAGRLRRALRAINARDYFPPPERALARRAVDELTATAEVPG
jgi:hypothetical protein